MLFLTIVALTIGGFVLSRINTDEKELYAPKGYMMNLRSRPRSVFA